MWHAQTGIIYNKFVYNNIHDTLNLVLLDLFPTSL